MDYWWHTNCCWVRWNLYKLISLTFMHYSYILRIWMSIEHDIFIVTMKCLHVVVVVNDTKIHWTCLMIDTDNCKMTFCNNVRYLSFSLWFMKRSFKPHPKCFQNVLLNGSSNKFFPSILHNLQSNLWFSFALTINCFLSFGSFLVLNISFITWA